jgi:hypothetical protein
LSSILRALKKLESELPHPVDALSLPRKIDTKKTISRKAKRLLRVNVLFIAMAGVVILTVAVWFFIGQKAPWSRKSVPAVARITPGASVVPTSKTPKINEQKMLANPAAKNKDAPKKRLKPMDRAMSTPASSPIAISADNPNRSSKAAAIRTPSRKADRRPQPLIPIKDTGLILQAISWDKNSENRIVVINNHIVREGETVDGFLVTLIGKDDVLVREGGNEWKLMFRLK